VLLHQARSAILLYGQRRVGKTSLLNRLGRMLPADIVPLFADLQGVVTASGHGGLLFGLARSMAGSARHHRGLPMAVPPRERFADDPFLTFDLWLDDLEHALGSRTGLVALDEFEALDAAFRRGRFDEQDVLGLLRHVIQHRHRLAVLVAGSHALEEIGNWATYLINSQAIHLSYLHADEARQLIERPMADFPLRYEEDAVEHLIDLTRGHPSLVQLLCYHVVSLKNAQPVALRWDVTVADIEAAVPDALGSGAMLFLDMRAQAGPTGTAILERLATAGTGAARDRTAFADLADQRDLDAAVERLLRRELIEHAGGGVRMQVELVRRWFAAAASQRAPGPAIVH
jgi:hypothetical protein